jgi:hypothetical protein
MSNQQAITDLKPPSQAYNEATRSIVYRLSELMFGSLLAAYALGFVGAIAAHADEMSKHYLWGAILLAIQYGCISITFAYLTTSFYLTYHAGILTMPQMPFERLGVDFALSIVQAIFFGISMIQPALFPVLLGINFHVSGKRKNTEYDELAEMLHFEFCKRKGRNDPGSFANFRSELAKLLQKKEFQELSGWGPMGIDIRRAGTIAISVGVIVIGLYYGLELVTYLLKSHEQWWWLEAKWTLQQVLIAVEVAWATVKITRYGNEVVKRRARFLGFPIKDAEYGAQASDEQPLYVKGVVIKNRGHDSMKSGQSVKDTSNRPKEEQFPMDEEFERLQCKLKELCTQKLAAG